MSIPATIDEALSLHWLSEVTGRPVEKVEAGPVDNRVSTNQPVRVVFADGSAQKLWIKGYFTELGYAFRHAGVSEAMYYRNLASAIGMRSLTSVYAEADDTGANVVVTEDVLDTGAVFLDALHPYSVEQCRDSLAQLALLHAKTWMNPECKTSRWLDPRLSSYTIARGVADIAGNFDGPVGADVPVGVRDPQRLYDAYKIVASDASGAVPWSVVHGDPHVGNLYLDSEGRPCFVDFQLVQRGPWYIDVGYHMASTLTVDDRRRSEMDLVKHYFDRLAVAGVSPPPSDEIWKGLRRGFIHGFFLWAITLKVDPRITAALVARLGAAVEDHNAYAEVGL